MNFNIASILKPYQLRVETMLCESIPSLGPKSKLRDACEYSLLSRGKRFRPILVFIVAEALGNKNDVTSAALAVEYFHTASMIADDLPCMDNDDIRRNQPTLHKAFDEGTALLATYALIAAGYERLAQNSREIQQAIDGNADRICILALENATYNTGLMGATGGQFLDINPSNLNKETILEVINKKTVSLFELSFVLGWLFGGGKIEFLDKVKKAAAHFGTAFQIADDLDDMEQDAANDRQINIATFLGKDSAIEMFHTEIKSFQDILKCLGLENSALNQVALVLAHYAAGV